MTTLGRDESGCDECPDVCTRHRSIDFAVSHCERRSPSPSLSTHSLSVTGCCLRMNGRFAPTPDVHWTSVFKPTRTSATMYADVPLRFQCAGFNGRQTLSNGRK